MNRTFAMSVALIAGSVHAVRAIAQCPNWNNEPPQGALGVNGPIEDQVVWDRDGNGPLPPVLVVGGQFNIAGTKVVSNIAMWDGTSWQDIAGGFDNSVFAVTVFEGDLYASGNFLNANGVATPLIARFDGTA